MIIQIFGTRKCQDSRKAERFFKERSIAVQFIDLAQKGISPGELQSIARSIPVEDLIDMEGREYERKGLKYMKFNIAEELLANPLLYRTPIVRYSGKATVGYHPEIWTEWIKE